MPRVAPHSRMSPRGVKFVVLQQSVRLLGCCELHTARLVRRYTVGEGT
jgi:hypothetical protein